MSLLNRETMDELKQALRNLKRTPENVNKVKELVRKMKNNSLQVQDIENLSFNHKYGVKETLLLGFCEERNCLIPVKVNANGEVVITIAKEK